MTESIRVSAASNGLALAIRVDQLSDSFETAFKSGGNPSIEDYLAEAEPPLQENLLAELIAIELECRRVRGESPTLDEYAARFEGFRSAVTHAFADASVDTSVSSSHDTHGWESAEIKFSLHPGQIIGEYTLRQVIGRGGMGCVYEATHNTLKRTEALKSLSVGPGMAHDAAERFQREVESLAKLNHENVVRAYNAFRFEGGLFLAMEHVDGQDLAAYVKEHGPLYPELAIDYILQAARGLQYAHEQNVIHRDVKPGNLLLTKTRLVKVSDLGLARASQEPDANRENTSTDITLGTIGFMSPEQARDPHAADARSDIYSLGCTLFYLLSGRVPYEGHNEVARIIAHRESPIPDLCTVAPNPIPNGLKTLFERMVAKDPSDRPALMSEVIADLSAILTPGGYKAVTALSDRQRSLGEAASLPPSRRWISWSLLVTVSLAALSAWFTMHPAPDKAPNATWFGPDPTAITISAPTQEQSVSIQEELKGAIRVKGWPVVYVRPDGHLYFPQPLVADLRSDGGFTAPLHFGVDATPDRMRFKVFVVVARDQKHARELVERGSLTSLPPDCKFSPCLAVYRENLTVPAETPHTVEFAKYKWIGKHGRNMQPGPNNWSIERGNLRLDQAGDLHLSIENTKDGWSCAEVTINRSLGCGEYVWVVSPLLRSFSDLDPNATLSFILEEDAANEIVLELAAWGQEKRNGQFIVQPCGPDSSHQFPLSAEECLTCAITWAPAEIRLRIWRGEDVAQQPLADWKYAGPKRPALDDLRAHVTFFLHEGKLPKSGQPQEIVINDFRFTPLDQLPRQAPSEN